MPSIEIDGFPIAYAEAGQGVPLVLVHGTLGDQRSFARQMEPLGAAYHVMSLSMRHCWPGSWFEGGDFTIDRHVADVAGFITALDQGPVHVLGHSRGGHIAFRLAERHPELVRALVLAEPGGELDESLGGAPAAGAQAGSFAAGAKLIAAGDIEGGLRVIAEYTGGRARGKSGRNTAKRSAATMPAPCWGRWMSGESPIRGRRRNGSRRRACYWVGRKASRISARSSQR
ncbi:MAG: alpha/beta hydrolase [Alphaproteobacteria bacterium]|nr:alpha/beta hydrolase [Alphaproteobacteria bacterium]